MVFRKQYLITTTSEQSWKPAKGKDNQMLIDAMQPELPPVLVGGRLKLFGNQWAKITSDPAVLDTVFGMHVELTDIPKQTKIKKPLKLLQPEIDAANDKNQTLLQKNAIIRTCLGEENEYVSNVFLTSKWDGGHRMILDLSSFNQFVQYFHFMMSTLNFILATIMPYAWMTVFDFQDAHLTIDMAGEQERFLKSYLAGYRVHIRRVTVGNFECTMSLQ